MAKTEISAEDGQATWTQNQKVSTLGNLRVDCFPQYLELTFHSRTNDIYYECKTSISDLQQRDIVLQMEGVLKSVFTQKPVVILTPTNTINLTFFYLVVDDNHPINFELMPCSVSSDFRLQRISEKLIKFKTKTNQHISTLNHITTGLTIAMIIFFTILGANEIPDTFKKKGFMSFMFLSTMIVGIVLLFASSPARQE